VLSLRYEDFLQAPYRHMEHLASFLEVEFSPEEAEKAVAGIRPDRAYAFRRDRKLRELYDRHRNHPLMRRLGYDALL
jgi:hypothetical protein